MKYNEKAYDKMKISIVTVTYNCQDLIRETIQSVIEQTFHNIEYLIIDGNSTDETFSIVLQYARENAFIKTLSEPDAGIYNAMNKSLKYISGDYVLFLNAGDYFYSKNVLDHYADYIARFSNPDILYGNAIFYANKEIVLLEKTVFDWELVLRAKAVCHQRVLAKLQLFKEYQFDEDFIYCADRDWLYHMYFNKKSFVHMDEEVVYYEATGFSSKECAQDIITEEQLQILKKYCKYYYLLHRIRIALKNIRRTSYMKRS